MTKKISMQLFFVYMLCCSINLLFANGGQEAGTIGSMSGADLERIINNKAEKENYLIIDVREPDEYKEGHVRYAINISVRELEGRIHEISHWKNKNVIVLCRSGKRSRQAAEILKKQGFTHLFNADGVASYNYSVLTKE